MTGITLKKDKEIYTYGQPMTALHIIADGKVRASYPGGSYILGRGDVIGICEICSEAHFISYTVQEDAAIMTYQLPSQNVLSDILQKHAEVSRFFLLSACRQIHTLRNRFSLSEVTCSGLYRSLIDDYDKYNQICQRYRLKPRVLNGLEEQTAFLDESEASWLNGYYQGLSHIYGGEHFKEFIQEPAVSLGILTRGSLDFHDAWTGLENFFQYQKQIASFYFNESGDDLFDFYISLYHKLDSTCEEKPGILADIMRIREQFKGKNVIDEQTANNRLQQFLKNLDDAAEEKKRGETMPTELTDSLNTILEFADLDADKSASFRKHINDYKQLSDRSSMDDDVCRLRRALTNEFYTLYTSVFHQTLNTENIPLPVWMFLYFGYVDEELAGDANTAVLSQIASEITDSSEFGVYSFYHWLMAIYTGQKEPSRNEFDQDYIEFISKQRSTGNLSDQEFSEMVNSNLSRVNFELENLFPSVNKVTFGRIASFCPIFTSENALKDLKQCYVSVSKMSKAIEQVRQVDYSAFYRDSMDMENINIMGKMPIHTECIPDIILLPNVGIRGVMWQEIEGKKRNTNGRMCFSVFHMEDLGNTFLRLTGEFRWELCKRVQGGRWNDISERSLTSEYFDYIQFYKKNHDLSAEAKERVRSGLLQAKNSFKEMFVRDYMQWVLFEGNGSPRLNKVARKIFFTYCPFPSNICSMLDSNPLYSDLLSQHRTRNAQKKHQIKMLCQKLRNSGTPIPESLEQENDFYSM